MHTVVDDHVRPAYAEICLDEKAAIAIGVLHKSSGLGSPNHGVTVERVLSVNGSAYTVLRLARRLHRSRHRPEANPAIPPPDQRQDERFRRALADSRA